MIGALIAVLLSWVVPSHPVRGPRAVFIPPGFEQPEQKPIIQQEVKLDRPETDVR